MVKPIDKSSKEALDKAETKTKFYYVRFRGKVCETLEEVKAFLGTIDDAIEHRRGSPKHQKILLKSDNPTYNSPIA